MSKKKQKTLTDAQKLDRAFNWLHVLYSQIPDTKGCIENICKEGGCSAWCCTLQNPQVLEIEFMRVWKHILKNWSLDQINDTVESALRNYLSMTPMKGCIFFDKTTKQCQVHEHRCYNCRLYAITPDEEFRPRFEKFQELYKGREDMFVKYQCDLVSTVDQTKVTTEMSNSWWNRMIEIEKSIGIPAKDIHDGSGGSYMTYHDHVVLRVCSDVIMKQLQILRNNGTQEERNLAVDGMMRVLRKNALVSENREPNE